jgi:stearoyl-CoA desaturase (delta-9 desaturase)
MNWCADHRRHHRHVDDVERDPYAAPKGFWFSHLGWMLREYRRTTEDFSNVRDLQRDPVVMWQERHYLVLVLVMNLGLPALLGWLNGDLLGMVLMAGLLRLVVVHHFTFFINSLAHMWGKRPYSDQTTARDNPWVAFLTFGEGYHNYHHSFQWDYRNGIRWWHFDPTKWMIRGLSAVRLTHGLKRCSEAKIERAKAEQQLARSLHKAKGLSDFEIWSQRLHHEYEHLVEVINAWSESRQRWTEAKADQLMHQWELVQIKRVYVGWKANLLEKKRSWTELTEQLAGLSRAAA